MGLWVGGSVLWWPSPPVFADAPPADARRETPAEAALGQLRSPIQDERRRGVSALIALLPAVRPLILEALPKASWSVQTQLIEVLTRDGSPQAVRALLDHLTQTDETQAVLIRMNLIRDEAAAVRLLAGFRADPRAFLRLGTAKNEKDKSKGKRKDAAPTTAQGLQRLTDLVSLLRRAEIESKFLSRKSRSGSTGYYHGQYDLLKDPALGPGYRLQSLEIVTGIALNEAVPVPGIYRSGVYRFMRPHPIEEIEFVGMAMNAIAELCTPEDTRVLVRLQNHLVYLDRKRHQRYRTLLSSFDDPSPKAFDEAHQDWEQTLGEYGELLACLAIILPDRFNLSIEVFLAELRRYRSPVAPRARLGFIAGILIRVGRYLDAIEAYEEYLDRGLGSRVLSHYNLACAWASFALATGASEEERAERRLHALDELTESVKAGWSDVSWMNEDRDLDAIRDTQVYRALVKQIEKSFELPDED